MRLKAEPVGTHLSLVVVLKLKFNLYGLRVKCKVINQNISLIAQIAVSRSLFRHQAIFEALGHKYELRGPKTSPKA